MGRPLLRSAKARMARARDVHDDGRVVRSVFGDVDMKRYEVLIRSGGMKPKGGIRSNWIPTPVSPGTKKSW